MSEPNWLLRARELAAIAQAGLAFSRDPYDRERFARLRVLACELLAEGSGADPVRIETLFAGDPGYATPKIDVRGAAFDADGRILMVREAADSRRWTLPGGWADVNLTPAENVAKEVFEESGFTVRVQKLAAAWDRARQGHPPMAYSTLKLFFLCEITGGAPAVSLETTEVAFFAERDLPDDLSLGRILPAQLARMFAHHRDPGLPTAFD